MISGCIQSQFKNRKCRYIILFENSSNAHNLPGHLNLYINLISSVYNFVLIC